MTRALLAGLFIALLPSGIGAQQLGVEEAARTITDGDFRWRVGVMAHDSMQGRDTPSRGLEQTAEWIASEFRRMGLRGGAEDGAFIQRYPLQSVLVDRDRSFLVSGSVRLQYGADVLPLGGGLTDGETTAEVVLISGSTPPSGGFGREVRDKHVVIVREAGATELGRSLFPLLGSLRSAEVASVLVTSGAESGAWAASGARAFAPSVSKGWGDAPEPAGATDFRPMLVMRTSSLERLISGRGVDVATLQARSGATARVQVVEGLRLTLTQRVRSDVTSAPNVVGILDGSDPQLMKEFVVFSGHMDHVGMGTPDENGDSIFNGADDDASGTAAVIEVAEAMVDLPTAPKRSMIFLVVSGEEQGLWGSEWYAEHPSAPIDDLVADFNTDMVGRNWTDTIVAIGKEHSDLGETLNRVNGQHPELRMTAIDDLWPEERFYFRSDHFNFARKGVPVLFFFNGTHEDYHGRDDEPESIDAEKAARIARLVFYLGVEVGNAADRPKWNPESYARIVSEVP
ncbi:MAG: M20/M25/M40 family metallo-hydrolase [Gemmatimonadetes bacterium]|nr:M20/M25/M40 family metallo-hydrolase [Gemmatimonadota bacterium]MDA1103159.1 M20/M25/M40 family metallo-hydrolase [Gemmatimonadota bacterium]